MDAVTIGCQCKKPVHFTIRSDMFNNPLFKTFLQYLNGIPVYRYTEEKEKMRENFVSIDRCRDILKKDGIIIFFAEGITLNDWKLKQLKSGISRIVSHAMEDEYLREKLKIIPVGLTYSDYDHLGKTVIIQTGEIYHPDALSTETSSGMWRQAFNTGLLKKMKPLVPVMDTGTPGVINVWKMLLSSIPSKESTYNLVKRLHQQGEITASQKLIFPKKHFTNPYNLPLNTWAFCKNLLLVILLIIPSVTGLLLNGMYYFPVSRWARAKTKGTIFYDALLCGLMTITYPLYVVLASLLLHLATTINWWCWIILLPFAGWCTLQAWASIAGISNYILLTGQERIYLQKIIKGEVNSTKHPG